jgi:hypothetical protein
VPRSLEFSLVRPAVPLRSFLFSKIIYFLCLNRGRREGAYCRLERRRGIKSLESSLHCSLLSFETDLDSGPAFLFLFDQIRC